MDQFRSVCHGRSDEAIADAGITPENIDKCRVGVIWGAGIGGLDTFQQVHRFWRRVMGLHDSIHFLFLK